MPVDRSSAAAAEQIAALGRRPNGGTDLDVARRVIRAEIYGLEGLAEALDDRFEDAVGACTTVKGRIIVTGIGKSGHVGRKIAATLASTGTPAQFVHPVEASHGDLGMIGSDDAILALSNSGETSELADIVAYSRRFEIPLIAITGGARSTLAEAADIVLLLPSAAEACPMGLAPTTSATMMMSRFGSQRLSRQYQRSRSPITQYSSLCSTARRTACATSAGCSFESWTYDSASRRNASLSKCAASMNRVGIGPGVVRLARRGSE